MSAVDVKVEVFVVDARVGSIGENRREGLVQVFAQRDIILAHTLFIRTPSGLNFTEYGKVLLTHARLVLKQLEHAQFEPRQLSIVTRRNGSLSNAAVCFTDCLLEVIRRHARSAKKEDRQLFETLRLLV